MLKSRKGFMLVEVVVVSVVVATVLVTLFTGLSRLSSAYEERNKYFDIDAAYISAGVNEALISSGKINMLIKLGVVERVYSNENSDYSNDTDVETYIDSLKEGDKVQVYFALYDASSVSSLLPFNIKNTFISYIDYINDYYNYSDDFTYMIVTELCHTNDDCDYYGLRVK